MSDRDKAIVQAYEQGGTLRQVGADFRLAAERVRQVLISATRKQRKVDAVETALAADAPRSIPVDAVLAIRPANALRNEGINTLGQVADSLIFVQSMHLCVPNMGKQSVLDVVSILKAYNLNWDAPKISRAAAAWLAGSGMFGKDDLVGQFGNDGRYGRNSQNRYAARQIPHATLEELRSVADELTRKDGPSDSMKRVC